MTRAFIVGNGPSLNETPLRWLSANGEVSFGMNRVNLHFDHTTWRPTHYVAFDVMDEWPEVEDEEILYHVHRPGVICHLRMDKQPRIERKRKNKDARGKVYYYESCIEHRGKDYTFSDRPEQWHLPQICSYPSTAHVAIQIAFLRRFNPIILLGMDLGFEKKDPNATEDPHHFHPEYRTLSDHPWENLDETYIHGWEIARRHLEHNRVRVYNATIGGKLEVFPRIDLEELF